MKTLFARFLVLLLLLGGARLMSDDPLVAVQLSAPRLHLASGAEVQMGSAVSTVVRVMPVEPQVWRADFHSAALDRGMRFLVILPEGCEVSTAMRIAVIYFLHGRGRDETTLLADDFSRRVLLASHCAIVLPHGEDGWYVDSPVVSQDRYATYLDEVIAAAEEAFPLRRDASGRAVSGWSMGG